jgi:lipopolysaccharide transport system permease protein
MTPFSGEITIRPTRGFRGVAMRDLWAYRDLMLLFVWRDFVARYKQTVLGPLWYVFQPLITTIIFTAVFRHIAELSTDGLPPTLFYLCGLLPWNYFAQTFNSTSGTLVANAGLFGKVYFPRLVVPIAAVLSNLIAFFIQFVLFVVLYGLHRASHVDATYGMRWEAVLLPLVLLQVAAISLGVGLWVAALTAKFRDFAVLSTFLVQLWMYVTPIIYPLAKVPEQWRVWVAVNPMAVPVEAFRYLLLGTGAVNATLISVSLAVTAAALISGVLAFQRVEKTFVDVI